MAEIFSAGGSCFCHDSKRDAHTTTISSFRSSYCRQITFQELSALPALFSAINRNGTRRPREEKEKERQWCDNAPAERANRSRRTCGAQLGQITWVKVNKLAVCALKTRWTEPYAYAAALMNIPTTDGLFLSGLAHCLITMSHYSSAWRCSVVLIGTDNHRKKEQPPPAAAFEYQFICRLGRHLLLCQIRSTWSIGWWLDNFTWPMKHNVTCL